MQGTIAITDHGWYEFLAARPDIDEVNFWTPSAHHGFNGEPGAQEGLASPFRSLDQKGIQ